MGKQLVNYIIAGARRVYPFCHLQSRARTHVVLVIGLYDENQIKQFVHILFATKIFSDYLLQDSNIYKL
jgi:hypothetical protein